MSSAPKRFGPEFHEPVEYACPEPDCDRTFDSGRALSVHRTRVHGPPMVECDQCGGAFEKQHNTANKYCSQACYRAAQRATYECQECGDVVEDRASVARKRTYCSAECRAEAQTQKTRKECVECGRRFWQQPSRDWDRCSQACAAEARHTRPRPDDPTILVWLLYVYEGHNQSETWLRANANRYPDQDRLTEQQVRDILNEHGWTRPSGAGAKYEGLTLADVGLDDTSDTDTGWSA